MDLVNSLEDIRNRARQWRREGKRVALVPTMGALHRGHVRLVEEARKTADIVVLSAFVNPTQFDDPKDLERYPRTPEADQKLAAEAGVNIFFAPAPEQVYRPGFQTTVNVSLLAKKLEGEHRPGHFRGVCTVVLKLFHLIQPTTAVFGWKDAQQYIILRHMVRDLDLDVELIGVPTVRDADGLALSSRNVLLQPEQREMALTLNRALRRVHFLVKKQGITHSGEILQALRSTLNTAGVQTDYAVIVSRTTLEPLHMVEMGNTLVALAIRIGDIRLIDNTRI